MNGFCQGKTMNIIVCDKLFSIHESHNELPSRNFVGLN